MSYFTGPYLRVLTPKTTDGITPVMRNDRMVFTEQHLPLTARKDLEKENAKRPDHLKHRIEVVGMETDTPEPVTVTGKVKRK